MAWSQLWVHLLLLLCHAMIFFSLCFVVVNEFYISHFEKIEDVKMWRKKKWKKRDFSINCTFSHDSLLLVYQPSNNKWRAFSSWIETLRNTKNYDSWKIKVELISQDT